MAQLVIAGALLSGVSAAAGGHITWLPLGDSITWGCGNGVLAHDKNGGCELDAGAYRIPVAQALEQWNVSVTTVGTRFAGPASQPDAWKHHDGHPGWRTSEIEAISENWTKFNPEIITILLGTNDLKSNASSILADMESLIKTTRTTLPNAHIFVASILDIPHSSRGGQSKQNQVGLNKGLPGLVQKWGPALATGGAHYVPLAENTSGVCGDDKLTFSIGDGVHPNPMGHLRVASVFARSILNVLCPNYRSDQGCSPQLAPATPPPTPGPTIPQHQVCTIGTVCGNKFSTTTLGCCPYDDAVCCDNQMTCCPKGSKCQVAGWESTCIGAAVNETVGLPVCKPGAAMPMSTTKKNVLIIGDSVSIGYTPWVAQHMQDVALVQHSPMDVRDGGAEETAYGVECLDYMLRSPDGVPLMPDVIMYNWGLHDGPLGNKTEPGQAGLPSVYAAQLEVITQNLIKARPKAKLLFALTSPQLCDPLGDGSVMNLNNQAAVIMAKYKIPTINLHDALVKQCGPATNASNACWGLHGCFCPHCASGKAGQGYDWLATTTIIPGITSLLQIDSSHN